MFNFSGQVVLVTGASGNLGSAAAHAFLKSGAHLVLIEREMQTLINSFPDLPGDQHHLLQAPVDVTRAEDLAQVVRNTLDAFGRIDVLANTVGGYRAGTPLHETPPETLDFMFRLNAYSVFYLSRAVIPTMLQQGSGKIIHVAARAALSGSANAAAYTASKSAVLRLTESMSAELKTKGINVNCILPGTIDTPQNRQEMPDADFSRWVQPEDMADVILFLASPAARAIHGASIPVYGLS